MNGDDINAFKISVEKYLCDANEVVNFKLVRNEDDIEEGISFQPEMSHQIFGEKEQIFGYSDLSVNMYYTASQLHGYIGIQYDEKINSKEYCGVEADDIFAQMKDVLPPGCQTNLDEFVSLLRSDGKFSPHGNLVHCYERNTTEGNTKTFEVFNPKISDPGFRQYHERMQTFLLWYVDAASYIDVDDDKWEYFTLFEKQKTGSNEPQYLFVGYCTLYNFYAYPHHCRPRVSQFLILPPYQRQGHATDMLRAVYRSVLSKNHVKDICVEDPSENFQRIRDFVDCVECSKLESFRPENLSAGFTTAMVEECNAKCKLNRRQARRVYEILRLQHTNMHDEESFKSYRLSVKSRLNLPFTKKFMGRSNLAQKILPDVEKRYAILESEFARTLEEYLPVVKRLNVQK